MFYLSLFFVVLFPFSVAAADPDIVPVRLQNVSLETIYDTYYYPATVEPIKYQSLTSQHQGTVESYYVQVGTFVEKDQRVLAFKPSNPSYGTLTIKAPFSGVITKLPLANKYFFPQGEFLFEMSDLSSYLLKFQVPIAEKKIIDSSDSRLEVFLGEQFIPLQHLNVAMTPSLYGTLDANAQLSLLDSNHNLEVALGELLSIRLQAGKREALLIDASAINYERNQSVVYTVCDDLVCKKVVKIAHTLHDGKYEVLTGLQKDDRYIIHNHRYLKEGQQVIVQ